MLKIKKEKSEPIITAKQLRFIDEYLIDLNGRQAAIRSGYSVKTSENQASRMLSKSHIIARVNERRRELSEVTKVNQEWVLNRLIEISNKCVQAVPVMEFDPIAKEMKQKKALNDKGEEVGVFMFDSNGANKATELIGKHLGFFEKDKQPINIFQGIQIEIVK